MNLRKTMRPITIKRVVEVCRIVKNGKVLVTGIMEILKVGKDRAKEVVAELQVMNLIGLNGENCIPTPNTRSFLENFEEENWINVHLYFYSNYVFYRDFVDLLSSYVDFDYGLSLESIQEEAVRRKMNLNRTAIEVLADWCDRLSVIQRHLYSGGVYLLRINEFSLSDFKEKLVECFELIVNKKKPREVFVEIPRLREDVCERCKMRRETFDNFLKQVYLCNIGKIELCGAPITTMAKRSPLNVKKIEPHSKDDVLAPGFLLRKEREGLVVGSKSYYYIAIHEVLT
jgi:hypothetical protein